MKKSISSIISMVIGVVVGAVIGVILKTKQADKAIEQKIEKVDKFKSYYYLLNQWMTYKQNGVSLEHYFIDNNYKTIAIYGMGELGNRLYEELRGSSIEIKYAIDKETASTSSELKVYPLDSNIEHVDVIVVTAIFAFEEIKNAIQEKVDYNMVSLEDVIYEIN